MSVTRILRASSLALLLSTSGIAQTQLVFPGGRGKHIVLIAGDQEYRSEESIPALARILSVRHGFRCTVLFATNRQTGQIDPDTIDNIPGLQALRKADLMVLFARWLELPDEQMKEIVDYTNSGRPIVALRTSTHPFNYRKHPESPYARFSYNNTLSYNNREFAGGYGRQVLGETWIAHYGEHQKQSTRGIVAPGMEKHPILRGVRDIWGESDVYAITTPSGDSQPLVMGQVLMGMEADSPPDSTKKLTPVAWIKTYTGDSGKTDRIFTTTMGHAMDFKNEGFRRMVVNACYWVLGMDRKISPTRGVDLVGPYNPNPIGLHKQKTGLRPADLR
jgi:Trehalose utilisation